jgi:predicted adenine nucleotide alpha hydrolase (AANH) superfamily ATPase
MKLLLHTCCGPCFLGVWEDLQDKDIVVTSYYYNPNIYPEQEYKRRLENLRKANKGKSRGLIVEDYESDSYEDMVKNLDPSCAQDDGGDRCLGCYKLRLTKTAEYAKKHGFDAFSTTLLVSPYQQHDVLKSLAEEISAKLVMPFYYKDWRPYFRAGQNEAKIIPIYRQKYCGCKFSLRENGR